MRIGAHGRAPLSFCREETMTELDSLYPMPEEAARFDPQAAAGKFRIVAIGDSITQCGSMEREQRWTGILERELGDDVTVVNVGIGGTSSNVGLFRWERDVAPVQPHCVIVNFLLNDTHVRCYEYSGSYLLQCSADRMEANLRAMVALICGAGAAPVWWTPPSIPPWPDNYRDQANYEIQMDVLDRYCGIIERLAGELSFPLANFFRTFADLVDDYPGPYFVRPDGYHSTAAAQPILAQGIVEHVRPILQQWRSGAAGG